MGRRVLGLDLSLTASGWALTDEFDDSVELGVIKGLRGAHRIDRVTQIAHQVSGIVERAEPELVVIEAYAFGARGQGLTGLGELRGVVLYLLRQQGERRVVEVSPTALKKFLTGRGNADKGIMRVNALKRWQLDRDDLSDDAIDAFAAARLGEALLDVESESNLGRWRKHELEVVGAIVEPPAKKPRRAIEVGT